MDQRRGPEPPGRDWAADDCPAWAFDETLAVPSAEVRRLGEEDREYRRKLEAAKVEAATPKRSKRR